MYFFASKPLRNEIKKHITEPSSVLDVSAGDDELILEIAESTGASTVVANDIAWRQMEALRKRARARRLNIIFSNHNVAAIPFDTRFDLVLYKNTLHHAHSKEELKATLGKLEHLAKRLIIVDVEEPRRSKLARVFNWYYSYVYGDAAHGDGHRFYTNEQFQTLVNLAFPDRNVQFFCNQNLRGRYMLAVVDLP